MKASSRAVAWHAGMHITLATQATPTQSHACLQGDQWHQSPTALSPMADIQVHAAQLRGRADAEAGSPAVRQLLLEMRL